MVIATVLSVLKALLELLHSDRPKKFRELARGDPPQKIHLEKAVLAVHESRTECEVGAICRGDCGNAERIALDDGSCAERRHGERGVECRQRRAQECVEDREGQQDEQRDAEREKFSGPPRDDGRFAAQRSVERDFEDLH